MLAKPAPTDQRAGVRPISFVLDDAGSLGTSVTLNVRPEDLTRNEPARATVHQTLGRDTTGWVDHFGEGLPSVTIAGHTGWRQALGTGMDGVQAFQALNDLVAHAYPQAKQTAIDRGTDPAQVKLLFVDMLDDFAWSVVPTNFVLRRSKSRPLLMQYNISLQAVSTSVDSGVLQLPFFGNVFGGLNALDRLMEQFSSFEWQVEDWVSRALAFVDRGLGPIASTVKTFVGMTNRALGQVNTVVRGAKNVINGTANRLIGIASDLASVGVNVFRTINNIRGLPSDLKAAIGRVASAYNEVLCIFSNSLRQRKTYEEYTGLYGASNCSSTTGGRQDSAYANMNAFELMQPARDNAAFSSSALAGVSSLSRMDPVMAPMPMPEIGRHLSNVVVGVSL